MVKGRTSTLAGSAAEALLMKINASKMMLLKKRNTVFFFIRKVALLSMNKNSHRPGFYQMPCPARGDCAKRRWASHQAMYPGLFA
jgi:hypothetical protein